MAEWSGVDESAGDVSSANLPPVDVMEEGLSSRDFFKALVDRTTQRLWEKKVQMTLERIGDLEWILRQIEDSLPILPPKSPR